MRVSLRAITLSSAILWGTAMLCVGLIHLAEPSYGGAFLGIMSSVYPGADTAPTLGRVLLGTLCGLLDGAVAGCLFGLLYRALSGADHHTAGTASEGQSSRFDEGCTVGPL